jgi:hypothetical protein
MPIFYVYMHNKVDRQDDEVYKLVAKSSTKAKDIARRKDSRGRFNVGSAYRAKDFRIRHPDWYKLLSDQKAETTP